jgi:lipopolysaccharide transport system ATP-binding protein
MTQVLEETVIDVKGLSKRYLLDNSLRLTGLKGMIKSLLQVFFDDGAMLEEKNIWALKDISFKLKRGERLGFVGNNGAGKSTLLKILSRITYPTEGEILIRGRITSLLEVGTGFLDDCTGRQNIYINASFHQLTNKQIDERLSEIIEFSELSHFIDIPLKYYSSGMKARLAFSVAAHLDPDILLLDEVLSVGDIGFSQKCLEKIDDLTSGNRTVIFVSHSMDAIRTFCTRCIWLSRGEVVMDGPVDEVTNAYVKNSFSLRSSQSFDVKYEDERADNKSKKNTETFLGDEPFAVILSAALRSDNGALTDIVTVDRELTLELIYRIDLSDSYVLPAFKIYNSDGILIFSVVHPGHLEFPNIKARSAGVYRSCATIQPHIFNAGLHKVSVSLNTPRIGKLLRHIEIEDALVFQVFEAPPGVKSSLGPYRSVRGAVRPLAHWGDELENNLG